MINQTLDQDLKRKVIILYWQAILLWVQSRSSRTMWSIMTFKTHIPTDRRVKISASLSLSQHFQDMSLMVNKNDLREMLLISMRSSHLIRFKTKSERHLLFREGQYLIYLFHKLISATLLLKVMKKKSFSIKTVLQRVRSSSKGLLHSQTRDQGRLS